MTVIILLMVLLLSLYLTMPDQALQNMLNDPTAEITPTFLNSLKIRLFKNNLTPGTGTVIGDFTEADFTGYAAISLSGFPASSIVSHAASSTGSQVTFTVGSSPTTTNNIYGWYVTNSAGTKLYGCQRDANAPIAMAVAGAIYQVTPTFSAITQ